MLGELDTQAAYNCYPTLSEGCTLIAAGVRRALQSGKVSLQGKARELKKTFFTDFMWYFNTLYFGQSAAGLAYQNGQQLDYSPNDLIIYLPITAAWMLFAGLAARTQRQAEQKDANNPWRHHPVILMRCFITLEAVIRAAKNVNWVITVAAQTAIAHGTHGLGMVGATGLTHCAGLALSLFTPIGIAALASGLLVGAMDAWYRNVKATRTAAGKIIDELNQTSFNAYAEKRNKEGESATFDSFLAHYGVQPKVGQSNTAGVAALASGLIHGAYRAANILFMVKLVSLSAASALVGPAAPIFLGLFAAYAIGNALYGLFKEGREQAELYKKRTELYDRLFPKVRELFERQKHLNKALEQINQEIEKQQKHGLQEDEGILARRQELENQLENTTAELNEQKDIYRDKNITLTPPPEPPKTFAYRFYKFCSNNKWISRAIKGFAAAETTINTVKNGCKLGAFIARMGLTLAAFNNPIAKLAGLVTMGVGLAIGALGLLCGAIASKIEHKKNAQQHTEMQAFSHTLDTKDNAIASASSVSTENTALAFGAKLNINTDAKETTPTPPGIKLAA